MPIKKGYPSNSDLIPEGNANLYHTPARVNALIETKLDSNRLPVVNTDPIEPANGAMWILRDAVLMEDYFTGADGDALNARWVVTKHSGTSAVSAETKVDIRSNKAKFQFSKTVEATGSIQLLVRMSSFVIDWSTHDRIIEWRQQPNISPGETAVMLNTNIATDEGAQQLSYKIRVIHSQDYNTYLQIYGASLLYNQGFAHGKLENEYSDFKLVIGANNASVTLYQDGVQKLQSLSPNTSNVTQAWLYLHHQTSTSTLRTINTDQVVIR